MPACKPRTQFPEDEKTLTTKRTKHTEFTRAVKELANEHRAQVHQITLAIPDPLR